jgi:hypothetical protein
VSASSNQIKVVWTLEQKKGVIANIYYNMQSFFDSVFEPVRETMKNHKLQECDPNQNSILQTGFVNQTRICHLGEKTQLELSQSLSTFILKELSSRN